MDNWISVDTELPAKRKDVLLRLEVINNHNVQQGFLNYKGKFVDCWFSVISHNVTHWQPLPPPPETKQ